MSRGGAPDRSFDPLCAARSCSFLIQENADPEVKTDPMAFFDRSLPQSDRPSMAYLRHIHEGPDDMPAHIKAALLPVSLQIPMDRGAPILGTWQGIYLVEHRRAPQTRLIAGHLAGKTHIVFMILRWHFPSTQKVEGPL